MKQALFQFVLNSSGGEIFQTLIASLSPVLWLRFDSTYYGAAVTNYGSAGATLNGTNSLATVRETGALGLDEAFQWISASAKVTIPADVSWSSATAYTFVFLVNLTGLGTASNGHLMFESNSFRIMVNSDSTVTANFNGSTATTINTITLSSDMLITVTMNTLGADKKARIYFNGAECTYSVQNEGTGTPISGTMYFGNNSGLARAIVGKIDEILFFTSALSLATIQRLNAAKSASGSWPIVRVTKPAAYEVIQRSGTTGTIGITGTNRSGYAGDIVARYAGGGWSTIATGVANNASFSGSLAGQPQGDATLDVAILGREGELVTIPHVLIGDVYLLLGQSNMEGQGTNNQVYSGSIKAGMLGQDGIWRELADPVGLNLRLSGLGFTPDTISGDNAAAGSPWPLMTTETLVDAGVPIGIVQRSKSATAILQWLPGANHQDRTTLYGSAIYAALNLVQGGIKAALWWQGESDANSTPEATYNSRLDTIANAINSDLGCKLMVCKLQDLSTWGAGVDETTVNNAIVTAWGDNSNVLTGPDFSDITPSVDGLHMVTDGELATAASRWADKVQTTFY